MTLESSFGGMGRDNDDDGSNAADDCDFNYGRGLV